MNEDKSTRYHRLRRRASLSEAILSDIALLLLIVTGAGVRLREGLQAVAGSLLPAGLDEVAAVVLVTLAVVTLLLAVDVPFSWYRGFVLEHRYGLSTQSARHWLADHARASVIGALLLVLAASVVFFTLRTWPEAWWVVSAAAFAVALVGLVGLTPVLLLPMFYRFRPLDRPALVERLMALAARARTDVVGVFEWALSGHSRKANAALAGLGRTRRILVSDTLLANYTEDEIEVVLAHELAHHVHGDLWRGLAVQATLVLAGFYVAHLLLWSLGQRLGYAGLADPAAIPLLMLIGSTWSFLTQPLANALSRAQERAADRYALESTRNPEAFVSAMRRLSQQNMAEDRPSWIVRVLFSSHPTIRERIDAARAFTQT